MSRILSIIFTVQGPNAKETIKFLKNSNLRATVFSCGQRRIINNFIDYGVDGISFGIFFYGSLRDGISAISLTLNRASDRNIRFFAEVFDLETLDPILTFRRIIRIGEDAILIEKNINC